MGKNKNNSTKSEVSTIFGSSKIQLPNIVVAQLQIIKLTK